PSGACQAKSPVDESTAVSRPHGGFWHGQLLPVIRMSNVPRPPPGTDLSYGLPLREPSRAFSIQPIAPTSWLTTKMYFVAGSNAASPGTSLFSTGRSLTPKIG